MSFTERLLDNDFDALDNNPHAAARDAQREATQEGASAKRAKTICASISLYTLASVGLNIISTLLGAAVIAHKHPEHYQDYASIKGVRTGAIVGGVTTYGVFATISTQKALKTIANKIEARKREVGQSYNPIQDPELETEKQALKKAHCKNQGINILLVIIGYVTALYPFGDIEDAGRLCLMQGAGAGLMLPLACIVGCCVAACLGLAAENQQTAHDAPVYNPLSGGDQENPRRPTA